MVSSRHDKQAVPVKPQKYAYLDKTCVMTTLVDMSMCMGEISQGSTPNEELHAAND